VCYPRQGDQYSLRACKPSGSATPGAAAGEAKKEKDLKNKKERKKEIRRIVGQKNGQQHNPGETDGVAAASVEAKENKTQND